MSSTHESDKVSDDRDEKTLSLKEGAIDGHSPILIDTNIEAAAARARRKFDLIVVPFVTAFCTSLLER